VSDIYDFKKYKKNKQKNNSFYALGIILVFILLILGIMYSPLFEVIDVEVIGNKLYTKEEIIAMLDLSDGNNFFYLLTKDIKSNLKKSNKIQDVNAEFVFPNRIKLNVVENPPLGYICQGNNYIYIDKEGVVIEISNKSPKNLPIITGLDVDNFKEGKQININNKEMFLDIGNLINVLQKYGLTKEKLMLDISNKFEIHIYINNVDVKFGPLYEIDEKVKKLVEVLKHISPKDRGTLDLSLYEDKIIFSPIE